MEYVSPHRKRGDFSDVDIPREARAALCRAERQVVLNTIPRENRGAPVVHVDRAGNRYRPLWKKEALAFIVRIGKMVGDDVKLLPRHVEDGAAIQSHRRRSQRDPARSATTRLMCRIFIGDGPVLIFKVCRRCGPTKRQRRRR